MSRMCSVGPIQIGAGKPLTIIAGPCVLESLEHSLRIARHVKGVCDRLGLPLIFKGSFDKANRTSIHSSRGPGLEQGLSWLAEVKRQLNIPITTDIHEPAQAEPVAQAVDILQIPAFLCRQTDLLVAAGEAAVKHNRAVNVKKGQFLSPGEMAGPIHKLAQAGCANVMITERGTFFGYNRLVNDFIGVVDLIEGHDIKFVDAGGKPALPPPMCFDCTHSTQLPGAGQTSGGRPERAPALARAAVASGIHALFLECHPDPARAFSDASTVQPLDRVDALLTACAAIRRAMTSEAR